MGTERLETKRLILRKFTISDADAMYNNWATDEKTCRHLSWNIHKSVDETKAIIQSWIDAYNDDNYNWVIELKDTHEIIGNISSVKVNKRYNTIELGYCTGSKYWNNGYVTEAFRKVLEYLLLDCGFYMVEACHRTSNPASGRVMQKAGMKKDAVLRERALDKIDGNRYDVTIYSIKKDEFIFKSHHAGQLKKR